MRKKIAIIIMAMVMLCFSGCGAKKVSDENYLTVKDIDSAAFKVLATVARNATATTNISEGMTFEKNQVYLYKNGEDEYFLFRMDSVVLAAQKGTKFNLQNTNDKMDAITNNKLLGIWFDAPGKKLEFQENLADGVYSFTCTINAEVLINSDLYNNFAGKLTVINDGSDEWALFVGSVGEDYQALSKEAKSSIEYMASSLHKADTTVVVKTPAVVVGGESSAEESSEVVETASVDASERSSIEGTEAEETKETENLEEAATEESSESPEVQKVELPEHTEGDLVVKATFEGEKVDITLVSPSGEEKRTGDSDVEYESTGDLATYTVKDAEKGIWTAQYTENPDSKIDFVLGEGKEEQIEIKEAEETTKETEKEETEEASNEGSTEGQTETPSEEKEVASSETPGEEKTEIENNNEKMKELADNLTKAITLNNQKTAVKDDKKVYDSSIYDQLQVGKKGYSSVFDKSIKNYARITVKLDSILKGPEAEEYIKRNFNGKYFDAPSGCAYEVAILDIDKTGVGSNIYLNVNMRGVDGNNLNFRGIKYSHRTYDIVNDGTRAVVFYSVPNGCQEYTLEIGEGTIENKRESAYYIVR